MSMGVLRVVVPIGMVVVGAAAVLSRRWRRNRLERSLGRGAAIQQAADGRMALTGLLHRDPQFNEEALLERCAEFQERYHAARTACNLASIRGVLLPGLCVAEDKALEAQAALLRKLEMYDITVSHAAVVEVVDDGVYDTVYVRLSGEAMQRMMHGGTNRWLGGGTSPEPLEEVLGLSRKQGVTTRESPGTLEGFCPQCGADLLAVGATNVCGRCGTRLDDGSQDWAVSYRGSPDGWRPSDVPPPDADVAGRSLTQLADTVTGLFWRYRSATLHADAARLAEWATSAFMEEHAAEFRASRDGKRSFHAAARIGRIEWVGNSDGRYWLRVFWKGLPLMARVPSFLQEDASRETPRVEDYVLQPVSDEKHPWLLAAVHPVQGEVPCPDLLDGLSETQRLERLPVTTAWDREIVLQTCVAVLLRTGPVTGRRLAHVNAAAALLEVGAKRVGELLRQVEHEGATMFGRDCKLPPDTLFRHLARVTVSCVAMPPVVVHLLRDVAVALGVEATLPGVLGTERRLLADAMRRIERIGRNR